MKKILILLGLISTIVNVRADFVIQWQNIIRQNEGGQSNNYTIKMQENKIRVDTPAGDKSMIADAKTGDVAFLIHEQKAFTKRSSVEEAKIKIADAAAEKPLDTGKSEMVGGYNTEIYTWSAHNFWLDTNAVTETLWVAKSFPNYDKIYGYLATLEKSGVYLPGIGIQPKPGVLPGMIIKTEMTVHSRGNVQMSTFMLVSANEESVDPSIFEIPKDYKDLTK